MVRAPTMSDVTTLRLERQDFLATKAPLFFGVLRKRHSMPLLPLFPVFAFISLVVCSHQTIALYYSVYGWGSIV